MKRTIFGGALLVLLLALQPLLAGGAPGSGSEASKWGPDHVGKIPFIIGWEKGLKEAEFTGKPMFVFFTATW